MNRQPIRAFKYDPGTRGYDLMMVPIRHPSRWSGYWHLDFEGQAHRSAMRAAYRAKTKHRRRNR